MIGPPCRRQRPQGAPPHPAHVAALVMLLCTLHTGGGAVGVAPLLDHPRRHKGGDSSAASSSVISVLPLALPHTTPFGPPRPCVCSGTACPCTASLSPIPSGS